MRKLRLLLILSIVLAMAFGLPVLAEGSGTLALSADKQKLSAGDSATITISIGSNPGITVLAVYAEYDTEVFTLESKKVGDLLENVVDVQDNTAGRVGFDLGDDLVTENTTATGAVASFVLKVKEDAPDKTTEVRIVQIEAYDKDINRVSFTSSGTTLTVKGQEQCEHELTQVPAVAATCEAEGNQAYYSCSKCGKYFEDASGTKEITKASTVTAALGHT